MSDDSKVICPNCVHEFRAIPIDVQRRIDELELQVAQYERDAARYRWLRSGIGYERFRPFIAIHSYSCSFSRWTGEHADRMIDEAMAEGVT